jgi:hypothetical protein
MLYIVHMNTLVAILVHPYPLLAICKGERKGCLKLHTDILIAISNLAALVSIIFQTSLLCNKILKNLYMNVRMWTPFIRFKCLLE